MQPSNSANAIVEGASAAFASTDVTARTRIGNYTQIVRKSFSVSYSEEFMNPAGVDDSEFNHQKVLKTKEIARDINAALINQSSASGTSSVARTVQGIVAAMATNTADFAGSQTLGQNNFNNIMQAIWSAGGRPNVVITHGYNKRQISNWASPSMPRAIDAEGKKLVVAIDIYDSDFGRLMVLLERELATTTLLILQEMYWKTAWFRPLFFEELGAQGGSRRGYVESEFTLEYLAENSSGKMTNLQVG